MTMMITTISHQSILQEHNSDRPMSRPNVSHIVVVAVVVDVSPIPWSRLLDIPEDDSESDQWHETIPDVR